MRVHMLQGFEEDKVALLRSKLPATIDLTEGEDPPPGCEILIGGRQTELDQIFGDALQLLHEHAADHGLIAIQTHGDGFPIQNHLPNPGLDEAFQLLLCRGALPARAPFRIRAGNVRRADPDRGIRLGILAVREPLECDSERQADHEKVNQRLPDQLVNELAQTQILTPYLASAASRLWERT